MKQPLSIKERRRDELAKFNENVTFMLASERTTFSDSEGNRSEISGDRIACRVLALCPKCPLGEQSFLYDCGVCREHEHVHAHVECDRGHEGMIYFVDAKPGEVFKMEITFDRKKTKESKNEHIKVFEFECEEPIEEIEKEI